ncbi:transcription termination factor Rho [Intrasporangium calvum]|nr:transcription termination factor Rho [Intrasporangium calvum]
MKLDELKTVATSMGIKGTARMRKSDLVDAIKARQSGGSPAAETASSAPATPATPAASSVPAASSAPVRASRRATREAGSAAVPDSGSPVVQARSEDVAPSIPQPDSERGSTEVTAPAARHGGERTSGRRTGQPDRAQRAAEAVAAVSERQPLDRRAGDRPEADRPETDRPEVDRPEHEGRRQRERRDRRDRQQERDTRGNAQEPTSRQERNPRGANQERDTRQDARPERDPRGTSPERDTRDTIQERDGRQDARQERDFRDTRDGQDHGDRDGQDNRDTNREGQQAGRYDDDDRGNRRSRNRQRSRDRKRGRGVGQEWAEAEPQIGDDDVLVPVAGILDVLENYAFVRTSGYLPGPSDVYVPLGMVKKHGLRKGDAVTGAVKALREGEQPTGNVGRQKFNALVRLDSVNGQSADDALKRLEFGKLTPLYPQQRLRLETESGQLTTRIIDLVAPIGKGQRGLIVAPAKAGKTMVMQALANAITTNNPECHLMVVLVDERPEEVTEMQRAVKGEVIASTFDRPADDHTTVAELAIERAKRLVELGHDVVVLLDSITKLGRAYNLSAPASGRILSGGVDSAALYPPKKFFGAARNIENGGSLTILATALVETGSKMDEVIFEEFKGTGNMELKLDRQLANRRIFPSVDINASGTRREEILLASEELKIMWKLRRVLGGLDSQQAIELLLDRLKKTKTNYEFLTQVQQTSSARLDDEA